jgi:hypothetical protein
VLWVGLAVVVAAAVAAAVAIPLVATHKSPAPAPTRPPAGPAAAALARAVNLRLSDAPAGWGVDQSPDGPLSGFLGGGSTASLTPAQERAAARITTVFERCMSIGPGSDRLFRPTRADHPVAGASSPALQAPGGGTEEVGSVTQVYATGAPVRSDARLVALPHFATCDGQATAAAVLLGAGGPAAGAAGLTFGSPSSHPLAFASRAGVTTAGTEVDVGVTGQGRTGSVVLQAVYVGGGRAEATLYTVAVDGAVPPSLTGALVADLQSRVAAGSRGA